MTLLSEMEHCFKEENKFQKNTNLGATGEDQAILRAPPSKAKILCQQAALPSQVEHVAPEKKMLH